MQLKIYIDSAPIQLNQDGDALVGGTRVRLETIIAAFHQGDSPEQIVDSFDVLSLADVYAVIAYYLNHREEVDAYIQQQYQAGEAIRTEIEQTRPEIFSLRSRLLALKNSNK